MNRASVNGLLKPSDDDIIVMDQYLGHFLKVSYILTENGNSIFSKDRVDVEKNGAFRFFLPKKRFVKQSKCDHRGVCPRWRFIV